MYISLTCATLMNRILKAEVVQLNIFEVTKNFRAAGGEDDAEERPDHEFHPTDLSATSFVDAYVTERVCMCSCARKV